jgi:hypothetical protein
MVFIDLKAVLAEQVIFKISQFPFPSHSKVWLGKGYATNAAT